MVLDGSLEITVLSAKIVFFFFFMQFLRTFFNAYVNFNKSGHYTTYRECIFHGFLVVICRSVPPPFQIRFKSVPVPIERTEGERRHNGGTTEAQRKLKIES